MTNGIKRLFWGFIVVVLGVSTDARQERPDFSGTWTLDAARSGSEPEVWLQRRAARFVIHQTDVEITIDTGDGSLFAVRAPVTDTPLRYRLDGSIVTVVDRSLGDLPGFVRKISTSAYWQDTSRLLTFTEHSSGTPGGADHGNTRVLVFSTAGNSDRELKVERTGYRGLRPDLRTLFGPLPKVLHNGRLEDDRAYATDVAFYTRTTR